MGTGERRRLPGRSPAAMRLARIQPAEGWSGCRGTKALTGDATARRCMARTPARCREAPHSGGIQQGGGVLSPPLARWCCSTTHILPAAGTRGYVLRLYYKAPDVKDSLTSASLGHAFGKHAGYLPKSAMESEGSCLPSRLPVYAYAFSHSKAPRQAQGGRAPQSHSVNSPRRPDTSRPRNQLID